MKKSFVLCLFISFIIAFNMVGVQKATPVEESVTSPSIYIPVIGKSQAPSWQAVKLGVDQAARDYGVQAVYEAPMTEEPPDIATQLYLLQTALNKNPQVIAFAAIDSKTVTPYLEQAKAKGIPVIGFDSGVDSPIVKTTVATDNYGAGELAADKMAQLIDGKGKVGVMVPNQISKSTIDRRDGFINTMREKYPNIEVLPVQDSQSNIDLAIQLTKTLITENPDIKGLFGANETATEGLVAAIKELNKSGQITIVGFDAGKIILDAVREGVISGAIAQDLVDMGYKTVETAIKASKGEQLPEFIETGFVWYDKSNMDDPEIKPLLYE